MLHKCYINVTFRFSHPLHPSNPQPSITQPFTPFPPFPIFTHFVLPPLDFGEVFYYFLRVLFFFYRKMVYFALYIELETSNKDSNELKNIEFLFKLYNNGTWFFLER